MYFFPGTGGPARHRGWVGAALLLTTAVAAFQGSVWLTGLTLALAWFPWWRALKATRGTELRAAVVWMGLALGLGLVAQAVGSTEPLSSGRPASGHWVYLQTLTTLAALASVLNARTPGGQAWAILMALLVLVMLIPWLEGPGLSRAGGLGRLRLESPWTLFYGLLVLAGVTNYLPTRYGPAAAVLGVGFVVEYIALSRFVGSPAGLARCWTLSSWAPAASLLVAGRLADGAVAPTAPLAPLWLGFRDHWGVVWALRVQERFNRTAEVQGWPVRLAWEGVVGDGSAPPDAAALASAEATLRTLLRRFAEPSRLAAGERPAGPLASGKGVGDDSTGR